MMMTLCRYGLGTGTEVVGLRVRVNMWVAYTRKFIIMLFRPNDKPNLDKCVIVYESHNLCIIVI